MSKETFTVHNFQSGDIFGVCVCVCQRALGDVWAVDFGVGGGVGGQCLLFHAILKRDLLRRHGNRAHTEPERAGVDGLIWPDRDGSLS